MKNPLDPYRNRSNNKQKILLKTKRLLFNVATGALVLTHNYRFSVCGSDWPTAIHDRKQETFKGLS